MKDYENYFKSLLTFEILWSPNQKIQVEPGELFFPANSPAIVKPGQERYPDIFPQMIQPNSKHCK